ncbi:GNAT family N-acetyltransferase [Macrococcus sp. DPC7161]|uniref:GNAT family N-acetyltransferase n=1 Tax=Macrococcus sp. DPC7161 TaxID=2507060 RepID=UPI00100A44D8|nr:GNAT family N-acetyltransferase [Macrococcus sp. DPC7161]RXK18705.1 GNAT family N-acetyltransferase [Macrococcus sp. DPC7161]
MLIRPIESKDDAVIHKIIQRSLESFGLDIPGTAYFDPELSHLSSYYSKRQHAEYFIVEDKGTVLGGVGIAPFSNDGKICELQKLYLDDAAKGLGISRLLMDKALEYASDYYEACYLETMGILDVACLLYEKYGFELLEQPIEGSDHGTMDRWYIKDL